MAINQLQAMQRRAQGSGAGLGTIIGTGLGAIGGAFAGNPIAGAQIGGSIGGVVGGVAKPGEGASMGPQLQQARSQVQQPPDIMVLGDSLRALQDPSVPQEVVDAASDPLQKALVQRFKNKPQGGGYGY